jgi:hypothetical protein
VADIILAGPAEASPSVFLTGAIDNDESTGNFDLQIHC